MTKNIKEEKKNEISNSSSSNELPFLKVIYEKNKETGRRSFKGIELSDGTKKGDPNFLENLLAALKRTTGTNNLEVATNILSMISNSISHKDPEQRMQLVTSMLHSLQPNDVSEALLLGQFLALEDCGVNCLNEANNCEMLYQKKELLHLGLKLFNCANSTMQTLLKYRFEGKQQTQLIRVYGDGKAIIANEMAIENPRTKK